MREDSEQYREKKRQLASILTVYGRKPVLEALQNARLHCHKLHCAESNKPDGIVRDILQRADARQVPVVFHSREALSRISKNRKQDQGIALDIACPGFSSAEDFIHRLPEAFSLIALDGVTNPQNVGMIIRTVCASPATGILLPDKGSAPLDSLVIKASAGTLFRARIIRCQSLSHTLSLLAQAETQIYGLEANAKQSIAGLTASKRSVFVLGNETHGLSGAVQKLCNTSLSIPMCNGVESLDVSVAAALIAFQPCFAPS